MTRPLNLLQPSKLAPRPSGASSASRRLVNAVLWLSLVGAPASALDSAKAIFAGGCFWCMEEAFEKLDGVTSAVSGYIGGSIANPTYKDVSSGRTGHAEAILVTYEPDQVTYQDLLAAFWHNVDPLDDGGQFCDRGSQYRSEIFAVNARQLRLAKESKVRLEASGVLPGPVLTGITQAGKFYPAEAYHQDYYLKNSARYKYYKWRCGRKQRLDEVWKASLSAEK